MGLARSVLVQFNESKRLCGLPQAPSSSRRRTIVVQTDSIASINEQIRGKLTTTSRPGSAIAVCGETGGHRQRPSRRGRGYVAGSGRSAPGKWSLTPPNAGASKPCRLRSCGGHLEGGLMPAAQWPLRNGRPVIEIVLSVSGGQDLVRWVAADTGAGTRQSVFQFILDEDNCLRCGGILIDRVQLGGAYSGAFPVYLVNVRIPQLNLDEPLPVVGVPKIAAGDSNRTGRVQVPQPLPLRQLRRSGFIRPPMTAVAGE